MRYRTACTAGTPARERNPQPRAAIGFLCRNKVGAMNGATMGCDRGFPCRDIVPLISCHDKEIVSQQSVAKAERCYVMT